MTPEEHATWKAQVRAETWARLQPPPETDEATLTTPPPNGGAPSPAVPTAKPSVSATEAPDARASSATSATATASPETRPSRPSPTTSARPTPAPGNPDTVWAMSPNGYVENGWNVRRGWLTPATLAQLSPSLRAYLGALATGNAEPIEALIGTICEYLQDAEDEHVEGRLDDALAFYFAANFVG